MATTIQCVSCAKPFDVADDDPLWSITTEIRDDGSEVITSRFIEPPCPRCGTVAVFMPSAPHEDAVDTGVVAPYGEAQYANRVEVAVADVAYDPELSASEQVI